MCLLLLFLHVYSIYINIYIYIYHLSSFASYYRTATVDGQYMAKILSTFSKIEQSRFEAFKRVSFPCDAVSKYVAHCLAERQDFHPPPSNMVRASISPQLQDLVVPGQEEEITTVVATLAKVYAQRLCAAAKAYATSQPNSSDNSKNKEQQQQQQSSKGSYAAIQPEHVLQAFYARKEGGHDPGFFLQPNEGIATASNIVSAGKEQMKRTAALAAQEALDKHLKELEAYSMKQKTKSTNNQANILANSSAPTPMDEEDSDSGDEAEVELDIEKELEQEMGTSPKRKADAK